MIRDLVRRFNFGKYRGRPISEVIRIDPGYVNWAAFSVSHFELTDQEIRALHDQYEKEASRIAVFRHSMAWIPQVDHRYIFDRVKSVVTLPAFSGGTYDRVEYVSGEVREMNHQFYTGDDE